MDYLHGATTVGPMGSKDLKWETTANLDLGFDFGILNNRINGSCLLYTSEMRMLILLKKLLARAIRFLLNWKCRLGLYQIKMTDDLRLWMNISR